MYRTVFEEDVKYMLPFLALNNKDASIIVQIFSGNKLDTFGNYINSFRMQICHVQPRIRNGSQWFERAGGTAYRKNKSA